MRTFYYVQNKTKNSDAETGERESGINEIVKIADYFNVSLDYLLERTNNPKYKNKP